MFDTTTKGDGCGRADLVGVPRWRRGRALGERRPLGFAWVLGLSPLLLSFGCASQESREAQARGPLPYQVGVYLDTETLPYGLPQIDPDTPRVQYLGRDEEILQMVHDALSGETPVVSHLVVLKANTREAALEEARGLDLLLGVGFDTVDEYTKTTYSAEWGVLETATFLFGGIPSWFVPTVAFETPARLALGTLDLHQPEVRAWYNQPSREEVPAFDWSDTVRATAQETSLIDRSSAVTDYLWVMLVPPMLIVPGEIEHVSETLTEGINEELGTRLAEALRDRLRSQEWVKRLAVAFVEPDPLELLEGEDMTLKLSLANREGGDLRRLEVMRLAPRASDFRWQASAEDLEKLSRRFRELSDAKDYVPFDVPERIPVAEGANLVKVRLVHESGEQIVRTMLYVR